MTNVPNRIRGESRLTGRVRSYRDYFVNAKGDRVVETRRFIQVQFPVDEVTEEGVHIKAAIAKIAEWNLLRRAYGQYDQYYELVLTL